MSAHTPGDWEYRQGLVVDSQGREIAYTHGAGTEVFRPTEMDANGRLCAAAPKLLEACKDLELRACQAQLAAGIGRKKNRRDFLLMELKRMQESARAVIAKVEENT